jgi:hypothetical protein
VSDVERSRFCRETALSSLYVAPARTIFLPFYLSAIRPAVTFDADFRVFYLHDLSRVEGS